MRPKEAACILLSGTEPARSVPGNPALVDPLTYYFECSFVSQVVKDFLLHCFQKDANLRVSARKLLRHPWMTAARRQLDQMKSGGSFRPRTVYDEAVKSVQEWNEALKGERCTSCETMRARWMLNSTALL